MEDSTGAFLSEAPVKLWLPGLGEVDPRIRRVVKAVRDYDPDLKLARHEVTGDWVITLREDTHPIFGFGRELPHPDDVERLLSAKDIKRHGKKIMEQLARAAERERLDSQYRTEEADEATAETMAWFYGKHGAKSAPQVFIPRSIPKGGE